MKLGVVGAGAWGTALAQVAASGGDDVLIWAFEPDVAMSINDQHINNLYLPDHTLSPSVCATHDMADLVSCDALLIACPAQHLRQILLQLPDPRTPLILCAKGIEASTGLLMSQLVEELLPEAPIAVLSGPTFAHEVAQGLPAAVTLACADADLGQRIVERLAGPTFRPYLSDDVIGAEIGGAVKNVLAIACGVAEGAGLGLNARAALISRGFAEMTRFGLKLGARAETLAGLCGLGDLVLTCSSTNSRNFSLGKGLGEGKPPADLLANRRTVAEGAFTAPILRDVARKYEVDMPLVEGVCMMLEGKLGVSVMVDALLSRPLRTE